MRIDEIQTAKAIVLEYFRQAEATPPDGIAATIRQFAAADYRFRGVHPFNELDGAEAVSATVWQPLRKSLNAMQRRQDIFFAGPNFIDGTLWVTSMGKFMGLMDNTWLGIPPTGKIVLLPYCEFHRIENGRIAESALWVDIISVMMQAGLQPLPVQTGAAIVNPGPRTADGVLLDPQNEAESRKTLNLILRMCDDLVGDGMESPSDMLRNTWHEDMLWFGPWGIGATYTIERYQRQHQHPFRSGLEDIRFNGHVLEHAEGNYGGWFGWPNMSMKQGEGFMGLPASDRPTEMRVVDIYRRDGDKLAENWIFIDLIHYLRLLGADILERTTSIGAS